MRKSKAVNTEQKERARQRMFAHSGDVMFRNERYT